MFKRGIVSREFRAPQEVVFDTWLLPDVRRRVLIRNRSKNAVKLLEPVLGGTEHGEDRWRNQLLSEEFRTYKQIERPNLIIAEVRNVSNPKKTPKYLPAPRSLIKEHLRFETIPTGTRLTVEIVPQWIRPRWLGPLQQWEAGHWELDLDVFEEALSNATP